MTVAITLVLGHLGHWYVGGPVFFGPVLAIVLCLKVSNWREQRRRKRAGNGPGQA